jgi:hypothetical protein
MSATRVISLDLDDTLWPVAPVLAAAEAALHDWLKERYPRVVRGHSLDTMRALRAQDRRAVPRAKPRPHVPAPARARLAIHRRRLCRVRVRGGARSLSRRAQPRRVLRRRAPRARAAARALPTVRVEQRQCDLERCGIGDLFDGHVSAIAAGAAKPDARIFQALRDMTGVAADPRSCTSATIRSPTSSARGKRACKPRGSIAMRAAGRWRSRRPRAPFRRSRKFSSTVTAHAALSSLRPSLLIRITLVLSVFSDRSSRFPTSLGVYATDRMVSGSAKERYANHARQVTGGGQLVARIFS